MWSGFVVAQDATKQVTVTIQQLHDAMVNKKGDQYQVAQYLDDSLSYGHSNWWIETKAGFLSNLGRRIIYHSIKEDSLQVRVNDNMAHARFIADIDVTLDGRRTTFHLKVLEVWVWKESGWKLFARQAVR